MFALVVKTIPLGKRICVKHAGMKTLRVVCDLFDCACLVHIPIRVGEEGGSESHEWVGCMYVLSELVHYAEVSGCSLDSLLSMNR